jgi:hypothetical protein
MVFVCTPVFSLLFVRITHTQGGKGSSWLAKVPVGGGDAGAAPAAYISSNGSPASLLGGGATGHPNIAGGAARGYDVMAGGADLSPLRPAAVDLTVTQRM